MTQESGLIVVLGMHRSGTSAVTRALSVLGVALGDSLLPAVAGDNDKGYWEDRDLNQVNIALLAALERDWDDLRPLSPSELAGQRVNEIHGRAIGLLRGKLRRMPLFGMKDPRICRLLPFWQSVFAEIGVPPRYVLCLRNPLSVADSLARRGTTSPTKSHYLWLEHMIPALIGTVDAPLVVVDYDRLIESPASQIKRLAAALGLSGRLDEVRLGQYCTDFLDDTLRHSQHLDKDLCNISGLPPEVLPLYELLRELSSDAKDPHAPETRDRILALNKRLAELEPILTVASHAEQQVTAIEKECARLEGQLQYRLNELALVREESQRSYQELQRTHQELQRTHKELGRIHAERGQLGARLESAQQDLKLCTQQRDQLLSSTSWRITAPVRGAVNSARHTRERAHIILHAAQLSGGVGPLISNVWRGLRSEGPAGARRRLAVMGASSDTASTESLFPAQEPDASTASEASIERSPLRRHTSTVEVIVCVHNALDDVRRCLFSVMEHSTPPYRLITVDDGSDTPTAEFLRDFMFGQPGTLLRNEHAQGYTLAANRGLQAATAEYVILLNSDTVVTPGWLDRMIACAESASEIGLVGPLSNTASWQSVPKIFDARGDWAENPLPHGLDVPGMSGLVIRNATASYPRVGLLNGFCLLLKRELIAAIGVFDEEHFGAGFGEENDYCLRAAAAGWDLAVATDTYIYHAQSRSYSHERRRHLGERADASLRAKHSGDSVMDALLRTRDHPLLATVRARIGEAKAREEARSEIRAGFEGRRVLFLLPIASPGGGANVVLSEANALAHCGVDVEIANLHQFATSFGAGYPNLQVPVRYLQQPHELAALAGDFDAVIATLYLSVDWLTHCADTEAVLGYYVQDFEPYFFPVGDPQHRIASDTYSRPGLTLFTKTNWNQRIISEQTGAHAHVVGPSLDIAQWFPPDRPRREGHVRVAAMVRPSTPRRAPERTARVLAEVLRHRPQAVMVEVFGVDRHAETLLAPLASTGACMIHGALRSDQMRALLGRSDIFLDLSDYQAMGLTCLEAMACDTAVIGPREGGLREIVADGQSGILVDTRDDAACVDAAVRLIDDAEQRNLLAANGIIEASRHWPERAALAMMQALFPRPKREQ